MLNGVPKEIDISEMMIVRAISGHVEKIVGGLKDVLESMAAETAAVLLYREIILTGGGALLTGLPTLLAAKTGLRFNVSSEPTMTTISGTHQIAAASETATFETE
jgi:rod shape-determining protein MreB